MRGTGYPPPVPSGKRGPGEVDHRAAVCGRRPSGCYGFPAPRAPVRASGMHADVAQLVEHHLAKVRVAGSSPVIRSEERGAAGARHLQRWVGREARHRPAKPFTPVRIRYPPRAIGAAGARFPDTEEVTGSIPVSPTTRVTSASDRQRTMSARSPQRRRPCRRGIL